MIRKLCLTIALLGTCTYAVADVNDTGYIGLGLGSVDYGVDSNSNFDGSTGFELILGKEISRNVSFELSYIDFGTADDGAIPVRHLEADAITAGALLKAKLGKTADVFVKLGMLSWDSEVIQDGAGVIASNDGTDIFYGFGAMVKTTDNLSIGARYNVYDFDGDDVTMFSINAQLSF
ncbi:MAG: porin family protein [Gammaproteobacteria bacterium]|nr:porin family protein [Gammaproteobacteria bacterium]